MYRSHHQKRFPGLVLICIALSLSANPSSAQAVEKLGKLHKKLLPEASGLAVSGYDEQRLWFINDSGNASDLIALELSDGSYSKVKVRKVANRDWEDLEAFSYRGQPWLAIADVGDNSAKRKDVEVHFLPEPRRDEDRVRVHTTITLRYEDGPRDVESVAVDSSTQTLYLLSKRDAYPQLYRVPLPKLVEGARYEAVAEKLGEVRSIPAPRKEDLERYPKHGKYHNQPTSMAALPDGSAIALMTYGGAYLAPLGQDGDWLAALNDRLCAVATPALEQAETIAADSTGRIYVTSEGKKAPLFRLAPRCPQATGERFRG
jgi:hypothetical protein